MANQAFVNASGNSGTLNLNAPAVTNVVWNLVSLSVSQAGSVVGASAKLNIYDGTVAAGTLIYSVFLKAPGFGYGGGVALGGSIGVTEEIPLPLVPGGKGDRSLQATPGNQLSIQVTGTGQNQVSVNARFHDGLTQ